MLTPEAGNAPVANLATAVAPPPPIMLAVPVTTKPAAAFNNPAILAVVETYNVPVFVWLTTFSAAVLIKAVVTVVVPIVNVVDVRLAVFDTDIKLPETIAFEVVLPITMKVALIVLPFVTPNKPDVRKALLT